MGPVLLLPPVAEVLVFPLDRLFPLPPAATLLPLPPSTCSGSYGWAWAKLPQTRALRHPVPLPSTPPALPPPPLLSPLTILPVFLCPAHIARCCVIYSSLGDMWSLCWIPRTPGSQCFWWRRKRGKKENNLTQPTYYQDILFNLREHADSARKH